VAETQRWVRYPGSGEFRGEGKWTKIENLGLTVLEFEEIQQSKYLPTHEGAEPPKGEEIRE
jgi:hypothetical protein